MTDVWTYLRTPQFAQDKRYSAISWYYNTMLRPYCIEPARQINLQNVGIEPILTFVWQFNNIGYEVDRWQTLKYEQELKMLSPSLSWSVLNTEYILHVMEVGEFLTLRREADEKAHNPQSVYQIIRTK